MGIKYSQIADMIETGSTDNEDVKKEIIERCHRNLHKRKNIPIYEFERKNYLLEI